ncbi:iron-siderophore ABC transporter substrate-binding protein [Bariatricus massiliensis]|uniref:Iron-siderophore ABC transporter substrate-binding protein n=1 Tax=Bariatricus massiliensis TaxID=1745713 RepID=A0ABS8DBA6_9FIRM|nr:iron-siderophore ABC transporter substrate-binding protein [Bariatricus massiliensis]MCB7303606.1 iron-siderophore ABC transporter substrate-binding protein [Bariatricus massiliensis]MCB7373021.1 iron-siderophore ABC transporter substrate-binding protein [Bariatricus massiliensis]MCB7385691.1 iron-siderophore ABC transporter substrate-binding protein [Bariatricus massiliensis]MCB7409854.1 iron-siderophore ABC transporter substrate-binding protein [Bariatricus massiliensis]MCQ5254036.1 iron-
MKPNKWITVILGMTLSALLLTGCGSVKKEGKSEDAPEISKGYPLTVSHAFGDTVLKSKPKRIVTLGWENQDTPLALGVVPVGVSAANYGEVTEDRLHPWTSAAYESLGETDPVVFDDIDGIDYEAISDAKPDVILAAYSGLTKEEYDLLSEIAPVVAYPDKPWQTYWRDQTLLNAAGMGMKAEGEAKVAETDALIQEKVRAYPELAGTKTAFFWISPDDFSTFFVYLPSDPRASYLTDLGLEFPESVLELAESSEDFSVTLSRENTEQLTDVEMMVVYGDETLLKSLQEDELMSQIPAIKNGAVVLVDDASSLAGATTPSILSIPSEIDDYLRLLADAHGKIQ